MGWPVNFLALMGLGFGSLVFIMILPVCGVCQSDATEQLLLDWKKLASMEAVLGAMKDGFDTLNGNLSQIGQIAEGEEQLRQSWMDSLLIVSSAVKQDPEIEWILESQNRIAEGIRSLQNPGLSRTLNASGWEKLLESGSAIEEQSLAGLKDLQQVLTDSLMRMDDGERLTLISGIWQDMQVLEQDWNVLSGEAWLAARNRADRQAEILRLEQLYGTGK